MRVDTPEHGPHDHHFGQGATAHPEPHEIGLGTAEQHLLAEPATTHGLLESVHHPEAAALGGHLEVGHLDHDFGDHTVHGLDGLHDSVHHTIGLGFGGDEHHTLHDGLHHDPAHPDPHHDVQHDVQHDIGHLFH